MWKQCRFLIVAALALLCVPLGVASAGSYDVSASVPYPVPSVAATFDGGLQNSTQSTDTVQLGGTCQVVTPYSIVTIYRQNQAIGSVTCDSNGTFRITVQLVGGNNALTARTSNIDMQYGPDSSLLTITYTPAVIDPIVPVTPTTGTTIPSSSPTTTPPSNLTLSTAQPFSVLDSSNTVTINIIVGGGSSPYSLTLNWGDGSVDSKTIESAGTYGFSHTYMKQSTYQIKALIRDVLGVQKEYTFVVVTTKPPLQTVVTSAPTNTSKNQTFHFGWLKRMAILVLIPFVVVSLILLGYWLGTGKKRVAHEKVVTMAAKRKKHKNHDDHFHFTGSMKWLTLFVIILLLVALAFLSTLTGQSVARIGKTQNVNVVKGAEVTLKDVDTSYFTARIPDGFMLKTQTESPNGPIKGQYMYAENAKIYSRQIGITVGSQATDSVEDISFVKQRRSEPERYVETQPVRVGGTNALVFRATDNTEVAAFIVKDGRYGAVVVTDQAGGYDQIDSILKQITQSWQWK